MPKYIKQEFSDIEIGYLTGIVDGEGSLTISQCGFTKNNFPQWQVIFGVTNTEPDLIDWFVKKFGSKRLTYTRKQTPNNSRKTIYRWQCTGERLRHLCQLILPHTVIKKRQVEIMIEMLDSFKKRYYVKGNRGPQIDQETIDLRYRLKAELHSLHNRTHKPKTSLGLP
ncbi:MAG: hypothetical protein PQJ44_06880 [Sphaerochaetaceae bacterium]|nr:hypothetical protein [Sphaerochaetaceae bacterium]